MAEETFDQLYGKKGIDTPYEREKITYRPDLRFSKDDLPRFIRPEIQQSIERSRTFTISQNLLEYDELIAEVAQMLEDIEARNSKEKISQFKEMLSEKQFKDIMSFEKQNSNYTQTGDYELYSSLYNMKASMEVRREFIDEFYRTQFTSETEIPAIEEAELSSISDWEQLEAKITAAYIEIANYDEDDDEGNIEGDTFGVGVSQINYETIAELEKQKRNFELFHTTLADTSYIHRNRYFMFMEIVEQAKILVYESNSLINNGLKNFIMSLNNLPNLSAPKSHLILQFRKVREKHDGLKGRMMTIDDGKETFASEKQYIYQQLETKTVEPIKNWLYEQEEGYSGALDIFSGYMVNSMKESRTSYDEINADMLNFYKSEADFYQQQISFLKEKEQIRKFYRILEDLEDVDQIRGDWVDEYLRANGYAV